MNSLSQISTTIVKWMDSFQRNLTATVDSAEEYDYLQQIAIHTGIF